MHFSQKFQQIGDKIMFLIGKIPRNLITALKFHQLSPDKAVGPDDISCRMLKLCSNSISPVLTRIFNISIATGNLPSCWKIANVVPVYKKGNRCDLKNYRPIALTSVVVKMLESFVSDHIRDHLMTNGLMYTDQHGFSPGKSCASALSEAVCEWNKILWSSHFPTPRIDLVSVDYSRAFDSYPTMFCWKSYIVRMVSGVLC